MKSVIIFLSAIIAFASLPAQETKTHSVYFSTASFEPDAAAMRILDTVAAYCKKYKASIVSLSGYCDSVGTTERNQVLSERRANAVKSVFVQKGIDVKSTLAAGKNETLEFGDTEFFRNRRVDIVTSRPEEKKMSVLEEKIIQAEAGDLIRLENISFIGGTPIPLPVSRPVLDELYQVMAENPTLEISIEGHICCSRNDEEDLSGQRAKAIYDFLISKGIAAERMTWKGFGHTRPLTEERNASEQQMNRRVEIRVVKK
ncbi:MAG: OmpA family protein [Bacteroidales bacterium]|jgi:outer membrane protein OmpA-like peptidoglycan-associated protein|nr:OmpA family protein [Bacteroidales bacterium]